MNWLKKVRTFLGNFWTQVFGDQDFLLGVENLIAYFLGLQTADLNNWVRSLIQTSRLSEQCRIPVLIEIAVDAVKHAEADIADITRGTKTIGSESDEDLWLAIPRTELPETLFIQNHVTSPTCVLLCGLDYTYENGLLYFRHDISELPFDQIKLTIDGELKVYYRMFGFRDIPPVHNDAVAGLIDPALADNADVAWDIHTNGATDYNVKQLLSRVTNSVVCKKDGAVKDIWTEQNIRCMQVGDNVYFAPQDVTCNYTVGASVKQGAILFGDLKMYSSEDTPSAAEVPGIRVNTDVGELTAPNSSLSAYVVSSYNVLPLTGDSATVEAYKVKCAALSADDNALQITIPATVNPMQFIAKTMRKRRGRFITMSADKLADVDPALDCIRKNTDASAVVTVFIRATGEAITADVKGFVADACMAAISEYQTVKLYNAGAEAKTVL